MIILYQEYKLRYCRVALIFGESMKVDVVKSNALVAASYRPASLWQMRLLVACLLQIRSKDKLSYKQVFSVEATALADLVGASSKNSYGYLRSAANELRKMGIRLDFHPDGQLICCSWMASTHTATTACPVFSASKRRTKGSWGTWFS